MKRVIIEVTEELHKELKVFCIEQETTLKSYVTECVKKDLETKKEQTH